jgi:carbonic anhydrase
LDWGNSAPDYTVNLNTFGDLMNMVDLKNRFIYRGSLTTPPCTQQVYWNVLHTVYPIKREHLDAFKAKMPTDKVP